MNAWPFWVLIRAPFILISSRPGLESNKPHSCIYSAPDLLYTVRNTLSILSLGHEVEKIKYYLANSLLQICCTLLEINSVSSPRNEEKINKAHSYKFCSP